MHNRGKLFENDLFLDRADGVIMIDSPNAVNDLCYHAFRRANEGISTLIYFACHDVLVMEFI